MKNAFETIDLSLLNGVTGGKKDEEKKKPKKEEKGKKAPAGPNPAELMGLGANGLMSVGAVMKSVMAPQQ